MEEVDKNILDRLTELTRTDYSTCTDINNLLDDLADNIEFWQKKAKENEYKPLEDFDNSRYEYGF